MKPSDMSDAQLRVRACELSGWTNISERDYCPPYKDVYDARNLEVYYSGVNPDTGEEEPLPALDHNFAAQLRAGLSEDEHCTYANHFDALTYQYRRHGLIDVWNKANASARQHVEAFVMTKGGDDGR